MERHQLAPGLSISRVVTGLWQVADLERDGRTLDRDSALASLGRHAAAGLTTFDMADHYGSAEALAGELRRRHADDLQLLTKWVPKPGPISAEDARRAVDRALERLQVESIDLLQLHAWSYADPSYLDALFHLEALRREGLIRHLGLTNFDTAHLRLALASGIEVVSNQVCFSLIDRRPLRGMLALCREHGVGLLAYGTLAGGFLTERWLGAERPDPAELETWSQMKYFRFVEAAGGWAKLQALLAALAGAARRHGVSIAQVACRWVLRQPGVAAVIVGARPGVREHVEENLALLQLDLGERSLAEIDAAAGELGPIPGDCGDEYRRPPYLTAAGDLSHHFDQAPPPYEVRSATGGRRTQAASGTIWEELAGFSRAVRDGPRIVVSGTTATHRDRVIGGADAAAQTHFVIDKIEGAIRSLGGRLEDVVRTRIYVPAKGDWEAVARVHGQRFGHVRPANTLVRAELVGDEYLVEMEAEALIRPSGPSS